MKTPSLESRIRGGIYGALVGDALGVPVEFSSRAQRDADPVRDMRAWGTWHQPAGTWSDDGALLLCTADATTKGFSAPRLGEHYVRWMRRGLWTARGDVFDIGHATMTSLERLADGIPLSEAGATGEDQNGNGSLMRILPIGLRFHRAAPSEICAHAALASTITHAHRRSQCACAFYSVVTAAIMQNRNLAEACRHAATLAAHMLSGHPRDEAAFHRLLNGDLPQARREEIESSGYVLHTLEAALWCAFQHSTFATTTLAAVNLGGDTDTTGCVAGGLAGTLYGFEAIPSEWIAALPRKDDIDALLDRFVPACIDAHKI